MKRPISILAMIVFANLGARSACSETFEFRVAVGEGKGVEAQVLQIPKEVSIDDETRVFALLRNDTDRPIEILEAWSDFDSVAVDCTVEQLLPGDVSIVWMRLNPVRLNQRQLIGHYTVWLQTSLRKLMLTIEVPFNDVVNFTQPSYFMVVNERSAGLYQLGVCDQPQSTCALDIDDLPFIRARLKDNGSPCVELSMDCAEIPSGRHSGTVRMVSRDGVILGETQLTLVKENPVRLLPSEILVRDVGGELCGQIILACSERVTRLQVDGVKGQRVEFSSKSLSETTTRIRLQLPSSIRSCLIRKGFSEHCSIV